MDLGSCKIAAFYKFFRLERERGIELCPLIRDTMRSRNIVGTVILAEEGVNSTICGTSDSVDDFLEWLSATLGIVLTPKVSYAEEGPFRKVDVKFKPEIVTLKQKVDITLGEGTHVRSKDWNEVISDPEVVVLDTRNDYEFRTGTFARAINPKTEKFSDLPEFVAQNLDPTRHKKVAMFCTGGIRCEKFAPYLRSLGFESVLQLEGGILKYLEDVPLEKQLWMGECYVFDTRVSVDAELRPAEGQDLSQES